jgi:hypothetical protein
MPEEVRALGEDWQSLADQVPGLTPDLEKDFRFGHAVIRFGDGFRLGGSIKGGSSSIWTPVDEDAHQAYTAWSQHEAIPDVEDHKAFDELTELLEQNDIELRNIGNESQDGAYVEGRGYLYRSMVGILRQLPDDHLRRPHFSLLQIGGWGPDSAKASAYDDGRVLIYDFAIRGARRTFLGLFLHELGHANDAALTALQRGIIEEAHDIIAGANALIGLEFLLDAESRRVYQQFLVNEFIAELYVIYTVRGRRLREYIDNIKDEPVRGAWSTVYDLFRKTFGGMEYE